MNSRSTRGRPPTAGLSSQPDGGIETGVEWVQADD